MKKLSLNLLFYCTVFVLFVVIRINGNAQQLWSFKDKNKYNKRRYLASISNIDKDILKKLFYQWGSHPDLNFLVDSNPCSHERVTCERFKSGENYYYKVIELNLQELKIQALNVEIESSRRLVFHYLEHNIGKSDPDFTKAIFFLEPSSLFPRALSLGLRLVC